MAGLSLCRHRAARPYIAPLAMADSCAQLLMRRNLRRIAEMIHLPPDRPTTTKSF
jgi:hypothetical protein